MQSHLSAFLKLLLYVSVTVSDLWSMNFFKTIMPPFCISDKITAIHIEMLALMKNVYTIVLVIITCILMELYMQETTESFIILCKPFNLILNKINITEVTGDAVVHAFATFILLTNFNVYTITYSAANNMNVYRDDNSVYKTVLYIDPTIESYSPKHIVYILVIAATAIVTLIPSLLLCIYPTRLYRYLSQFISAKK